MAGMKTEISRENGKRLIKLINELKAGRRSDSLNTVIWRLERIRDGKDEAKIQPMGLYLDVIDSIRKYHDDSEYYEMLIRDAEAIYDEIFMMGENTPDFEEKEMIFRELVAGDGIAVKGLFDRALFYSFNDKKNYIALVNVIATKKNAHGIFQLVKEYGLEIREYQVDDTGYLTNLLRLVERLSVAGSGNAKEIAQKELIKVQRSNGIYDVDPVKLAQVEQNVKAAAVSVESGRSLLQMLDRKCHNMELLTKELDSRAQEIRRETEGYLDAKARTAKSDIEAVVREYEEGQKKSVFLEKELFLKQMFSDAESELTKYKSQAKSITAEAATQMRGLTREADDVIRRMKNVTTDDEKLRLLLEKSRKDDELVKTIEKLTALKNVDLEALAVRTESPGPQRGPAGQEPMMPVHGPGNRTQRPIEDVNPLLDRRIPFKERFAQVKKEKERRIAEGALYHEMFDDVITAVMENVNPYLIGPSGCGKTYMVKQIGELLNLDCTDIGYINEEYDLLGYVTAMGDYNESNFYRLYKYGGIAFCDELDNGNSKATVKLNSFLTNQENSYYSFPGGERVSRHPNFRVIAAGNTDGNGADVNYSTREKIEESVQQRMIPIYVGYDNRVEKEILKKYPDWYEFACAFRNATDLWEESCGIPAQGIFTTRDAYRIRQYLDNGSFTVEKIMNYEFVQTKEPEYLGFLKDQIPKMLRVHSSANDLYRLFAEQIKLIRDRGRRG